MQLEDYLDFYTEPVEVIRVKGTRINIDFVIELYKQHMTPEQIAVYFGCPITVEQAYATITYYLHNKDAVEAYLARGEARWQKFYAEYQSKEPPEVVKRLRAIKAAQAEAS